MILEAGSTDFSPETCNFPHGFCQKPPKNSRIWKPRIRCPYPVAGYVRFSRETKKTAHRIPTPYFCFYVPAISTVFRQKSVCTHLRNRFCAFSNALECSGTVFLLFCDKPMWVPGFLGMKPETDISRQRFRPRQITRVS